jgi:NAD(P)H-dependent FMN reductase
MAMTGKVRVLAFAGSARKDSWNKKLVRIAARGAEAAGAEVTIVDFREYPMPLYDGDLEAASGMPEHARRFKQYHAALEKRHRLGIPAVGCE